MPGDGPRSAPRASTSTRRPPIDGTVTQTTVRRFVGPADRQKRATTGARQGRHDPQSAAAPRGIGTRKGWRQHPRDLTVARQPLGGIEWARKRIDNDQPARGQPRPPEPAWDRSSADQSGGPSSSQSRPDKDRGVVILLLDRNVAANNVSSPATRRATVCCEDRHVVEQKSARPWPKKACPQSRCTGTSVRENHAASNANDFVISEARETVARNLATMTRLRCPAIRVSALNLRRSTTTSSPTTSCRRKKQDGIGIDEFDP